MMISGTRSLALAVLASLANLGASAGGYAPGLADPFGGHNGMTSPNRRPAGAHKAHHRAAMKLRRVKKERAKH